MVAEATLIATEVGYIPSDWNVVRLGDVGEALIGLTYSPSQISANGTLVLRSSNIKEGQLAFEDNVFVDADIPDRIMVRPGDVLVCVRNGSRPLIGKSAYLDKRTIGMTFGAFMAVYRSDLGRYAGYIFQSAILKKQINEHLGATINQITNKSLNGFRIPLPPTVAERQAIEKALEDVDAGILSLERLIVKKRDIKQAAMQQLLTGKTRLPGFTANWEPVQLSSIGDTYGGLIGKSKADFDGGTARYVTFMNVMTNVIIDPSQFEHVRVGPSENQNRVRKGDLLLNGSSETPEEVAYCSVVDKDHGDLYLNSFCFGLRPFTTSKVNGYFIACLIRSATGREVMKSLAQGSTRYNISKTALKQAVLKLPTLDEQNAVAEVIRDMSEELSRLQRRLAKSREIKQGMMQQLLTGKVRLV